MVVEEHLDAIAERDGHVGAFRVVLAERALAEARALQERADLSGLPLAGVPIAIKDNVPIRGEASRNGSAATPDAPADEDHPVVARLRAAGAVVVGITNVPELCLAGFSDSVYGVTRNPWDLGRTPGGSSGGSAAAVAAGMVPLAHGNDGLGSLRIPAACCGLVSIKPGHGVVPPPEHDWYGMSENGPLATTVADLALALAVMADDMSLATPGESEALGVDSAIDDYPGGLTLSEPLRLRIAVAPMPLPSGLSVDAEFQRAVTGAAEVLGAAGHTVVEHPGRCPSGSVPPPSPPGSRAPGATWTASTHAVSNGAPGLWREPDGCSPGSGRTARRDATAGARTVPTSGSAMPTCSSRRHSPTCHRPRPAGADVGSWRTPAPT